jgi:hypothetical protein
MIEKVARALWDYNECGESGLQWDNYEIGTMSDLQKQIHIDMAKLVIKAMREPTSKMQNDYYEMRMATGHGKMQSCFPFAVWECAVDAALKEE